MSDVERLTRPDAAKLEGAITGRALMTGGSMRRRRNRLLNGASTGAPA